MGARNTTQLCHRGRSRHPLISGQESHQTHPCVFERAGPTRMLATSGSIGLFPRTGRRRRNSPCRDLFQPSIAGPSIVAAAPAQGICDGRSGFGASGDSSTEGESGRDKDAAVAGGVNQFRGDVARDTRGRPTHRDCAAAAPGECRAGHRIDNSSGAALADLMSCHPLPRDGRHPQTCPPAARPATASAAG